MRSIEEATLNGRTVLLRIDADVPMKNGRVDDAFRLQAALPTISFLLNRYAKVILLAHLGRPGGKIDRTLTLRPVYNQLAMLLKKPIYFAPSVFSDSTKQAVGRLKEGEILGLENLRFDRGEEANSRTFARKLAAYGDIYVDDAFAVSHHAGASNSAIVEFLPSFAGLTFEREFHVLSTLLRHPARPFVAIIGGAKVADKLPAIRHLLAKADRVLVGGGVANTFLKASGVDVRQSLVDNAYLEQAKDILKRSHGRLVLPVDYRWHDDHILDIDDQTIKQFLTYIGQAQTIFWNGPVGKSEQTPFNGGSKAIAQALAESRATTIIGGGDTIELIDQLNLVKKISFISTGGGSTLALLSGQVLPAVKALAGR